MPFITSGQRINTILADNCHHSPQEHLFFLGGDGAQNWLGNHSCCLLKEHHIAFFHTKYLKNNFLERGWPPSKTLPPRNLWHLDSAPWVRPRHLRRLSLGAFNASVSSLTTFWASVCKTFFYAIEPLSAPVLSVCCNVGALWPNGWTDQDETSHAGRPRPRRLCVR